MTPQLIILDFYQNSKIENKFWDAVKNEKWSL